MRFVFCFLLSSCAVLSVNAGPVAIAIHGGAGTMTRAQLAPQLESQYREVLDHAVSSGHEQLQQGVSGEDVVVAVIKLLEDSPLFNAGMGAVMTWEGRHELDASIMRGGDLMAGAVAGVTTIKNPIAAAQAVMNQSVHVLLSSTGAEQFARSQGLEMVDNAYFTTTRRREAWQRFLERQQDQVQLMHEDAEKIGTVGVVVLDTEGHVYAGTSTGGMTGKRWGRIGDSPIIGAGTYANDQSCAVSATGHGEFFIRYGVARDICARVQYLGLSVLESAEQVVNQDLSEAGADGGVIALDPEGHVAMVFNTEGMYRASIDASGDKIVAIYKE